MAYALFQHSIEPLDTARVARALDALHWLARADAPQLVRRAHGVLVDSLSRADAEALADALADQDQHVEVVEQAWRDLPQARSCRRAVVAAEGFQHQDLYGRSSTVPWRRILLLAAGRYGTRRRVQSKELIVPLRSSSAGWRGGKSTMDRLMDAGLGVSNYEEREDEVTVLELVTDEPARYRIQLDQFDYSYLGARRGHSAAQNFPLLVTDVVTHAPDAARTRGTSGALARQGGAPARYLDAQRLEREIAWTLWHDCGPGSRLEGGAPYRVHPGMRPRLTRPLLASAS